MKVTLGIRGEGLSAVELSVNGRNRPSLSFKRDWAGDEGTVSRWETRWAP